MIRLHNYSSLTNNIVNHLLSGIETDPQERRVIALLISGATNQEIAEELCVSKKWASQLVLRVAQNIFNVDGGRAGIFRRLFEELDTIVKEEDTLIEKYKNQYLYNATET